MTTRKECRVEIEFTLSLEEVVRGSYTIQLCNERMVRSR
jgi:hypothetical protein